MNSPRDSPKVFRPKVRTLNVPQSFLNAPRRVPWTLSLQAKLTHRGIRPFRRTESPASGRSSRSSVRLFIHVSLWVPRSSDLAPPEPSPVFNYESSCSFFQTSSTRVLLVGFLVRDPPFFLDYICLLSPSTSSHMKSTVLPPPP